MAEYIEREAAIRAISGAYQFFEDEKDVFRRIIKSVFAADVVPVVHGRWDIRTDDYDCEYAKCSVCGEEFYDDNEDTIDITFNYCPNCGARMDGE